VNDRQRARALLLCALVFGACDYVVVPPEAGGAAAGASKGWTAVATSVGPADDGQLRIDLTIRNETADWSAMEATGNGASLTSGGSTTECSTVVVGTGGHRLGPGMQMRGFIAGPKADQTVELIRVECDGAEISPGADLSLDYRYVTGEYNYYDPDASTLAARLEVPLDQIAAELAYPIAEPVVGLIQSRDIEITAINDVLVTMASVERTADGLEFAWTTSNPGEYPASVHIGNPPVIGSDGIVYGFYESPDLASVPITPPAGTAEWITETAVPAEAGGFYILLSVESKKQRLFVNYAIDIADV